MNEVQTLRQLLQKAADLRDLSGRGLADLATANGWNLNRSTVSKVLNGTYSSRPSSDTIRAVAWLAGVSERIAFEAAGQPVPGSSFADELPEEADLLTPRERKVIVDFIRILVEHHQQPTGETDAHEDQESRTEEGGPELGRAGGKARKPGAPMNVTDVEAVEPPDQLHAGLHAQVQAAVEAAGLPVNPVQPADLTLDNQGVAPDDAGEQKDYALARRAGETEERRRRRLEGEPWDHADPEGPEDGA